ncbi:uncharacterized protein [Battus philenor]|uniref:uncharacterized protein n=1 Tax=Battus philenor TaxID=42288 RepID=UPI0035D0DE05
MTLHLALSVAILQLVGSASSRTTVAPPVTPNVLHPTDSLELQDEEISELLQQFLDKTSTDAAQKNLARLTIEPYRKKNYTRVEWKRTDQRPGKKRTITPLAIIVTNLPDVSRSRADTSDVETANGEELKVETTKDFISNSDDENPEVDEYNDAVSSASSSSEEDVWNSDAVSVLRNRMPPSGPASHKSELDDSESNSVEIVTGVENDVGVKLKHKYINLITSENDQQLEDAPSGGANQTESSRRNISHHEHVSRESEKEEITPDDTEVKKVKLHHSDKVLVKGRGVANPQQEEDPHHHSDGGEQHSALNHVRAHKTYNLTFVFTR